MDGNFRKLELVGGTENASSEGGARNEPSLRIAIATEDGKMLNAHFGSARKFALYEVSAHASRFLGAAEFDAVSNGSGAHAVDDYDRIGPKVAALSGCSLLFVLAIGGPAAARVVGARIHPVKLPAPEPIESVLRRVQTMLAGTPPPWLRKAMAPAPARSMDFLDKEDGP
ncbi:MAG: nitrogen fixation protein NifX [Polyangiaceae bacterium]|jgi:nitrogen fixation protein NifX